ncbi:FISUMP domain-containing protein [Psychroflexus tropicus]|uniref:FISUMP domain-containing protein n=1 Tax=Psychroflexus tropicus TaxID=197345 RepID=UPI00036DB3BB|nr:FISUMP domain-containing protein [Psychroflexus tropicus]
MKINSAILLIVLLVLNPFLQKNVLAQNQNLKTSRGTFTDTRDDKVYKTITIGSQVWLAENFAYLPKVDTLHISVYGYKGTSVRKAKKTKSYKEHGVLYSWEYANKLAPKGWRLPTDADWIQLETEVGMSRELAIKHGWRGDNNSVGSLKENGDSGFNIKFAGWRTDYGDFRFQNEHANFWAADSHDKERAYERLIGVTNERIGREFGNKGCGFSVRYVRDIPAEEYVTYPENEWEMMKNVSDFGWSQEKINQLYRYAIDSTNSTGIIVIQSGKMIYDYGDTHEISYIASVRKSMLSMLYGKYIEDGTIDLSKTLKELKIDDIGGLSDMEKQASILDILESKSGVFHAASNPGGNEWLFPERGSKKPGSFFIYNNWDFNVAGYIFEQETELNIYDAFEKDIAEKIEFQQWNRSAQRKSGDTTKSRFKAYHFDMSTRDMARVGYLMLRKGKWKDEQVIPASWIDRSTSITTSYSDMYKVDPRLKDWSWWKWGQGLMWRIWDSPDISPEFKGAYTATGNQGQYITIIPSMDIVVALKTKGIYGRRTNKQAYEKFLKKLFDAKK